MKNKIYLVLPLLLLSAPELRASTVGHYTGGDSGTRDYFASEPGLYFSQDLNYYASHTFKDQNGHAVTSITIPPASGPGVILNVGGSVHSFSVSPTITWILPWEVGGGHFSAAISPTFANTRIGAAVNGQSGASAGGSRIEFGVGDLFVQPIAWDRGFDHWEMAFSYAFYAPVGKYQVNTLNFPTLGVSLQAPATNNIGLGFWTHQFQAAGAWYPWASQNTAVVLALTGEVHSKQRGLDLNPGAHLTFEWGISQFVNLSKNENFQLDLGPSGFSQWQITDDTGNDAQNGALHSQVHGIGAQLGLNYNPWNLSLTARYMHEFGARNRIQGQMMDLCLGFRFWSGGKTSAESQPSK